MIAFIKKLFGRVDANKDGRVDAQEAKTAAKAVAKGVETAAKKIKADAKAGAAKVKIARARKSKA